MHKYNKTNIFIILMSLSLSSASYGDNSRACHLRSIPTFEELEMIREIHGFMYVDPLSEGTEDEFGFSIEEERREEEKERYERLIELDEIFLKSNSTNIIGLSEKLLHWRYEAVKHSEAVADLKNHDPKDLVNESKNLLENYSKISDEFHNILDSYHDILIGFIQELT
jgi:hypothetical protein